MTDPNDDALDFEPSKTPAEFAGQKLFIQGNDRANMAMLGWIPFPWDLYAAGYKEAADALLRALTARQASLDSVVYPLVFLYRQGLELKLKLMLQQARHLANKPETSDTHHKLMPMWRELRQLLELIDPRPGDKEVPAIEDFISQLDSVDPLSFAFRYPTNKKGEVSLPGLHHVNVRHLGEIMDSVFFMLNGIYSYLGEMNQDRDIY
ncbi:hypothetical protein NU688_31515 [Variovorax sp. ZS18.2.2]|uniref:hypothetical protein n=1 Tax=Variovorax sp. ZS18.2.2 TaxID=2971255 RepID=UPI002151F7E1|nr:hypothetical protein [Variovorax sp. ZS18.2.2]MCR6480720.1 hypothetical protein [Variovorax sp. ZS18.2.2]